MQTNAVYRRSAQTLRQGVNLNGAQLPTLQPVSVTEHCNYFLFVIPSFPTLCKLSYLEDL